MRLLILILLLLLLFSLALFGVWKLEDFLSYPERDYCISEGHEWDKWNSICIICLDGFCERYTIREVNGGFEFIK